MKSSKCAASGRGVAFVPGLAVFAAAAHRRDGVDAAEPHPGRRPLAVAGPQRDAEAAIGVEQGPVVAVERQAAAVDQGHRHLRAVATGDEDLTHNRIGQIVPGGGRALQRQIAAGKVEPLDPAMPLIVFDLQQQVVVLAAVAPKHTRARPPMSTRAMDWPSRPGRDARRQVLGVLDHQAVVEHAAWSSGSSLSGTTGASARAAGWPGRCAPGASAARRDW